MQFPTTVTKGPLWDELLAGLSRRKFCTKARVARESLDRWAKGESKPREGSIAQIALALGRDPEDVRRLLLAIYEQGRARCDEESTEAFGA